MFVFLLMDWFSLNQCQQQQQQHIIDGWLRSTQSHNILLMPCHQPQEEAELRSDPFRRPNQSIAFPQ